jgi:site-specific DNA-cytosine methylase
MTDNIKLLYIDLFCGAGGTSTGVECATVEVNMARVLCEALCKKLNQKKQAV